MKLNSITTLALILFAVQLLPAQNIQRYTYDWRQDRLMYWPIEYQPSVDVKQITYNLKSRNKNRIYKYVKEYNNAGKITSYLSEDKKGKLRPWNKYYYEKDTQLVKADIFLWNNDKPLYTIEYKRTPDYKKPLEQKKTKPSGKIVYRNEWKYNADSCLTEFTRYGKGGTDIEKKFVYEHADSCKISKSTLYNGKNKVKEIWTYNCDAAGQKLEKKKDETQVCEWKHYSGDTLTYSYQTFDEKGRVVKNVGKSLLPDTLMIEWSKSRNDIPYVKHTYDKSVDKPLTFTDYNKKGEEHFHKKYEYQNGKIASIVTTKKGNPYEKAVYTYNADNLLVELKKYDNKPEPWQVITLEYQK